MNAPTNFLKGNELSLYLQTIFCDKTGELAEWLNAAVLKTVKDVSPSGVRIPDSPLRKNKPRLQQI